MLRISDVLSDNDKVIAMMDKYDEAIIEGETAILIRNKTLEDANREQAELLVKYSHLHTEVKNIGRMLDSKGDQLKAGLHRNIRSTSDKSLSDRTIDKFVDGEQSVLDHAAIVIEFKMLEEKLAALVEAIKIRGFALNNITKARVEGVHLALL